MEDCVRIIDIEADNFYIAACIMDLEARYEWCFIGVYASPKDGIRKMQWKELERKINGWGENGLWQEISTTLSQMTINGEKD